MTRSARPALAVLLLALAAGAAASPAPVERDDAPGRRLYWRLLEVDARLDADGALHVTERQVMEVTGAWNGGERRFRVAPGQRLRLVGVRREVDGDERPLAEGSLDVVDRWSWVDGGHVLRWRSRAPTDPPYSRTELTYVLEYVLEGVLVPTGDGTFRLAHDFAFADRPGVIEELRASLELDAAWDADGAPLALVRHGLLPGDGAVLAVALRWVGAGEPPAGPVAPLPDQARAALLTALAAALALAAAWVVAHDASRGIFSPWPDVRVDEAWLRQHVLAHPPEVIGAAWDGRVGAPEVSAVLARLAAEGKLEARMVGGVAGIGRTLWLRLRVDRETLRGADRALVDALFFAGDVTNSRRLREHYRRSGLDPSSHLGGVAGEASFLVPRSPRGAVGPVLATVGALLATAITLGWVAVEAGQEPGPWIAALAGAGVLLLATAIAAVSLSPAASAARALPIGAALALGAGGVAWLASPGSPLDGWALGAVAAAWAIAVVVAAAAVRTPLAPEGVVARRRLVLARRHLARELRRPMPRLDDAWIPYLLAFGLGPGLDRWVRVHGARGSSVAFDGESTGGSGSFSPRWTGGGGTFSGGGASGSWAALGEFAAGVPSASSGSGGSSGSSGGSSSGGGGGGGW